MEFDYSFHDQVVTDPNGNGWLEFTIDQFVEFNKLGFDNENSSYTQLQQVRNYSFTGDCDLLEVEAFVELDEVAYNMNEREWIAFAEFLTNNK